MTDQTDEDSLKDCPFCGADPTLMAPGSNIDIECECGAYMTIQKSDHLTMGERRTWNSIKFRYSDAAEAKAFQVIAARWNRRTSGE